MKPYRIAFEVSGPLANWPRPDTGGAPISSAAPTWSGVKGLYESIAFLADGSAWIHPMKVEICRRRGTKGGEVKFQRYATNYNGPLRKDQNVKNGTPMQFFATVLADVCYRLHAEIRGDQARHGRNPRHHLQELFNRRLEKGQCFRTPALGWRESTGDYWGSFREEWEVDGRLDLVIPSMLHRVWDRETDGRYSSSFQHDVRVEKGVLTYAE